MNVGLSVGPDGATVRLEGRVLRSGVLPEGREALGGRLARPAPRETERLLPEAPAAPALGYIRSTTGNSDESDHQHY